VRVGKPRDSWWDPRIHAGESLNFDHALLRRQATAIRLRESQS
jgi:hypothetical protein